MSEQQTPRTTVVIPVWDGYAGPRLVEALASVRDQDRTAELLVVDNASHVMLPELDGARVVRCPARLTLGAARNFGLAEVGTAYVIFWDADDVMLPGTIAYLEDGLAGNVGLLAFGAAIVEEPSHLRHRWPRRWVGRLTAWPRLLGLADCVWSMFPATGSTIMRTNVVRDCGGYADADSGEDRCLGVSLLLRGRVGWSERPGRLYLQHPGSVRVSHSGTRHQLRHAAAVRHRIQTDAGIPDWVRRLLPGIAVAQVAAITAHRALHALRLLAGLARR